MSIKFECREIPNKLGEVAKHNKAIAVDSCTIPVRSFAFIYKDRENYTIAWNGYIDFSILEKAVLVTLPSHAFSKSGIRKKEKYIIVSHLILSSNEILKFEFDKPDDYDDFRHVIERDFRGVSFARFDVFSRESRFYYSITATNPSNKCCTDRFTEMAIRLPLSEPITSNLVAWILDNHKEMAYFGGKSDETYLANLFSECLEN